MSNDIVSWRKTDYSILAASFVPAAVLTWGLHECAHGLMGIALGYEMWITFNQAGPVQGHCDGNLHQILVTMAGPVVTWVQAIAALFSVRRSHQLWAYSSLFLALWTRGLAMGVSFLSNPNDEARVSLLFGLPMWVIPALSIAFLFALTYRGSRSLKVGWKGNVISYVMASILTAILVFSDRLLFG